MGDLDTIEKDQLISSELDGGQLAKMISDCQMTDMAEQLNCERNKKPSSRRNSLKQAHGSEFVDPGNDKKIYQQTQLLATGAEYLDRISNLWQTSQQVPDFSCESEISTSNYQVTQNPTEDSNCSELAWVYGDAYTPEIQIHELEQFLNIQSPESNVSYQPQQGDSSLQGQDCFVFGNFSSTTASNLPNETVTDSMKYIESSSSVEPDCILSEGSENVTSSSHSVDDERKGHPVAAESDSHPVEDSTVSDLSEMSLITTLITDSMGNIKLHSLKSSDTDTVIVGQTEQVCSSPGNAYENTACDQELLQVDLGEILNDVYELEDGQQVADEVDFGLEELPSEFPETGSLLIPTTVDDWEVSDDESCPKKVSARRRRMKSKAESQSTAAGNKGPTTKQKQKSIFTYLLDSLYNKKCNPRYIKWTDEKRGQFKIVNGPELAKNWSDGRNRHELKYGHFARAMRHYYKKDFLKRVPGKKLMYEFGEKSDWRLYKSQCDVEFI